MRNRHAWDDSTVVQSEKSRKHAEDNGMKIHVAEAMLFAGAKNVRWTLGTMCVGGE